MCPIKVEYYDYNSIQVDPLINTFYAANWRTFYRSNNSNQQLEFLNTLLTDLHNMYVPIRITCSNRKSSPWFNADIGRPIVNRDLLYKKWKCSRDANDLQAFKRARNSVNSIIRSTKQNYYASRLHANLPTKELWKNVKKIGIKKSDTQSTNSFTADDINNMFCQNFTDHVTIEQPDETNQEDRESFYFNRIDQTDVVYAMNSIKSNALGLDKIPMKFLKAICPILIDPITHLFNSIVTTSVFPEAWKKSKIIPIKKKANLSSMDNLRPISILCALTKIFEKIDKTDISNYISRHNLMNQYQSGYRSKHSTKTTMLKIIDDIGFVLDNGRPVVLVLLDFSTLK